MVSMGRRERGSTHVSWTRERPIGHPWVWGMGRQWRAKDLGERRKGMLKTGGGAILGRKRRGDL